MITICEAIQKKKKKPWNNIKTYTKGKASLRAIIKWGAILEKLIIPNCDINGGLFSIAIH